MIISTNRSALLETCNQYHGPYISIRSEWHALLFHMACTNCIVIFSGVLRVSSVFLSLIMPPRPSKRHNHPVSLDPKSLTLAELNVLPRNSLVLLASAQNLVTTGTKMRLAQHVYEHECANGNQTQVTGPCRPAPPTSNVTPEVSTDADPPLRSPDLQQGQQPSSGSRMINLASFVRS